MAAAGEREVIRNQITAPLGLSRQESDGLRSVECQGHCHCVTWLGQRERSVGSGKPGRLPPLGGCFEVRTDRTEKGRLKTTLCRESQVKGMWA